MSLFKVLKGDSSRISLDVTPFHDGWCYYTNDDGGFYIDSLDENGAEKRTRINPAPYVKTFAASDWQNGVITVPQPEHKQMIPDKIVFAEVYMLIDGKYSSGCLAAMDTAVTVAEDKSVVLEYDGAAYAGKVIIIG